MFKLFGTPSASPPTASDSPGCSFCGKEARDVRQLVAAPNAMICDECVRVCRDVLLETVTSGSRLAATPQQPGPIGQCALCWELYPIDECVVVADRGRLCAACLDAVGRAITIRANAP